jgi:transposase
MFQDEARFGRICDVRKCWAPKGTRPVVKSGLVREFTYVYSAISPQDGEVVSLILPESNTYGMEIFLQEVSARFPKDLIVMVLDRASWHRSKLLKVPTNIKLYYLPPYSPTLNPVEHFWQELREKYFHNKYFQTMDELQDYLADCLAAFEKQQPAIQKMTYWPWIKNALKCHLDR